MKGVCYGGSIMEEKDYKDLLSCLNEEQFTKFINSLNDDPIKGACYNPKNISFEIIKENIFGALNEEYGFLSYPFGTLVGNDPLYFGGAFYPLDHSSFAVSRNLSLFLKDKNDLKILDLCAAPGGKSIALSSLIKPSILVCNDISFKRAEVLKLNVERSGIENVVVTSQDPHAFLKDFEGYFDCVILDAPCSGSGMTRKKEKMEDDWSWEKVEKLVPIQKDLIELAYKLVKKNGLISYSTCSYAKQEDEQIVCYLMENHEVELLDIPDDGSLKGIEGIGRRYIPGLYKGEGQYQCILKKLGDSKENDFQPIEYKRTIKGFDNFYAVKYKGIDRLFSNMDKRFLSLNPLKIGYAVDDLTPYAKCPYDWDLCHANGIFGCLDLNLDNAKKYIRGEDLLLPTDIFEDKIIVASYNKMPLGFLKGKKGRFRNYLPKGLRIH